MFEAAASLLLLLRGSSHDVEQKIHTRARKKEHEVVLRSMNMKKDSPHSFTDASVPRKKGSAGPVQERRESATIYGIPCVPPHPGAGLERSALEILTQAI